ncbi:MAG: DNA gyrase subunit A [Alphaproteobacteria bacterium]|nr:MAG: DNA gyrase subunit A [Alphaproteobacteria bacterium]
MNSSNDKIDLSVKEPGGDYLQCDGSFIRSDDTIFENELKWSYLDYAMSVISSRAVPDAYDGLKPVQRRILFSMIETNCVPEQPHKKSARIVGDVLGKYHPHGDGAIYDAMARMAQDFSLYIPLIDGQGNFGSIDGDKPASMRYTEARLAKITKYLLEDYDKDTVNMSPNYDGTLEVPDVLPVRFPNLLVNGTNGIAVGVSTLIPTHNLSEVIDATCALIDNPHLSSIDLMEYLPAPDFPLGGVIFRGSGLVDVYTKGKGSFIARGQIHEEQIGGRNALVITSMPYQVSKESLLEKFEDLMQTDVLNQIHIFRDESNRDGMRLVLELKKDADPDMIINRIYKFTAMQSSIHVNMLALHKNKPIKLNLRSALSVFLDSREEVLIRQTRFFLHNDRVRAHVLWGLSLAVKKLDEVIHCIKSSQNTQEAQDKLQEMEWSWDDIKGYLKCISDHCERVDKYYFSEEQAKAILNLRLSKLTGLERDKLWSQLEELGSNIVKYLNILNNRSERFRIIKDDLNEIRANFGSERRTELVDPIGESSDEDYVKLEDMVVTISSRGYIKRMPLSYYKLQKRGGKGKSGMDSLDDPVEHMFVANTHQEIIFFSSIGYSYSMKVYKLPMVNSSQQKGRALVNLFPFGDEEKIMSSLALPKHTSDDQTMIFVTSSGYVRRSKISDFEDIRSNGKIAMKLGDGEKLVSVMICNNNDDILLTASHGKVVRFKVSDIRIFESRASRGVIGMDLGDDHNQVVSATLINSGEDSMILTVSKNGYGKRTNQSAYRTSNRAVKGFSALEVTQKTGKVLGAYKIQENNEILMMTEKGQVVRCESDNIRVAGRRTQGVRLARITDDQLFKIIVINDDEIELED